jgi:two-component system, chemotaxis family, CheB/CheR fusion protein
MTKDRQKTNLRDARHPVVSGMALSLAEAEKALREFTANQADAIVSTDGKTYLLQPAQQHLIDNERWLNAIIDCSADAIVVMDRSGTILSQNPAVSRLFGYESREIIGISLFNLVPEEHLVRVHSAFVNVIEGIQENGTARFDFLCRDGSHRIIEATLGRLHFRTGEYLVFNMRPVSHSTGGLTKAAKFQASARHTPLQNDRFLAMLAHELRTPLMPVLLCIGEMREDGRFAAAEPILAMMKRNIDLQTRLLEELSDLTAVGQRKIRLKFETIDAHEAVRFVLEICRGELASSQIDLLLDLRASENMVSADTLRLQQVMWNLMRNAIKFSAPGSTISIASSNETPGSLTLEFVDHGIGIEPAVLPLVFDPFQQAERLMGQKHYGGLGLGLFIAKGLTEAQDGTLVVSSEGLGHGATFRLTLKLATDGVLGRDSLVKNVRAAPAAIDQIPE